MPTLKLEIEDCQISNSNSTHPKNRRLRVNERKKWRGVFGTRLGFGPWPKVVDSKLPKPMYKQALQKLKDDWADPVQVKLKIILRQLTLLGDDSLDDGLQPIVDALSDMGWIYNSSSQWLQLDIEQPYSEGKPSLLVFVFTFPGRPKVSIQKRINGAFRRIGLWLQKKEVQEDDEDDEDDGDDSLCAIFDAVEAEMMANVKKEQEEESR